MAQERSKGLGKIELLVMIVIITSGLALLVSVMVSERKTAKRKDCISNLKCIALSISMYEDKFHAYPAGVGGDFLSNLRRELPDAAQDGLFACGVKSTKPGPGVCDYRGPNKALREDTSANAAVCSDRPDNHGSNEDVNVSFFDGHVETAPYDSAMWLQADRETR